jgi:ribonuclease HI
VRAGVGLVFVTPEGGIIRYSLALTEPCTNNEAEYEALIVGLELSLELEIKAVRIFGDSQLIINQVIGEYKVLKPELIQYHQKAMELIKKIPYVSIEKVTRAVNGEADALAKLAKELGEPTEPEIHITVRNRRPLSLCQITSDAGNENAESREAKQQEAMIIEEDDDWRQPFIEYFQHGTLPNDKRAADQLRKRVLRFAYVGNTLYRRSYDQLWLRCVSGPEAEQVMREIHFGLCGAHQFGPKMKLKIKRMGYYWPTMVADCEDHAKKCCMCQMHGPFIHQAPNPLHPTVSSWPFSMWGTDIVGPIDPPTSRGHRFILAATDYFTKWAEAVPLKEVKASDVVKLFKTHILYRFSTPQRIISDNGTAFKSSKVYALAEQFNIDWRFSSIYNPRANGLAEAFNKTLINIMKKMIDGNQRDWDNRLQEALWAYRITYRTPTQATPYSLAFGVEAVLPLEVELPSLRVAMQNDMTMDECQQLRLDELDAMDEKRLMAQQNLEISRQKWRGRTIRWRESGRFNKGSLFLSLRGRLLAGTLAQSFLRTGRGHI